MQLLQQYMVEERASIIKQDSDVIGRRDAARRPCGSIELTRQ